MNKSEEEIFSFGPEEFSTEKGGGDSTQWMLSFIDLVSLLTSFFVLMFSMSAVRTAEFDKISKSFNKALNPGKVEGSVVPQEVLTVPKTTIKEASRLDYLYSLVYDKLSALKIPAKVRIVRHEDRIVISLEGDDTFAPGGTELTKSAAETLPLLGDILSSVSNQVEVVAGPDAAEPQGGDYPSGWELAVARALTVADILKEKGYFRPIDAFGRAVTVSDSDSGIKYNFARRIDIVIEDKKAKIF